VARLWPPSLYHRKSSLIDSELMYGSALKNQSRDQYYLALAGSTALASADHGKVKIVDASDFNEFFCELYGYRPFHWQKELMKQVIESGWPSTIDLPTSAGKTAVIDVSIFHLAMEADKPPRIVGLQEEYSSLWTVDSLWMRRTSAQNKSAAS